MPTALVTGGGIRIGKAICLALGRSGYDVIVHVNKSIKSAEKVVQELRSLGRQAHLIIADLETSSGIMDLVSRVPSLDLLVNNAAVYEHIPFQNVSIDQFDRMFSLNLKAPFFLIQHLYPKLINSDEGSIVNVTDMGLARTYTKTHFISHYLASKAGLAQLTKSLAIELAPKVRINAVAPGLVGVDNETSDEQRTIIMDKIPLARMGNFNDVADAVVYLANANYLTGQTITVCGGLSIT